MMFVKITPVFTDQQLRFSLEIDEESGRTFVSFPVANRLIDYLEYYEIDRATFDGYVADPTTAHAFVAAAKARQMDHLLLYKPGRDRGVPS
jgi:endo-beta-N-acetylglucosaminidase D